MEIGIRQAKADLSKLIQAVHAGERVVITNHGKPLAEIIAPRLKPRRKDRGYGMFKGQFPIDQEEWKRLDKEIERDFYNSRL